MSQFLKKHTITIFLVLITFQSGLNNLVHPVTPAFIHYLNFNDYMFGVAFASMNLMMFIFSFYWADASNKIKMNKILSISVAGYGVAQIIFLTSTIELQMIIARLVAGIFAGGFLVGQMNFIVDQTEPDNRGETLTKYTILMILGSTVGFFIGGVLGDINLFIPLVLQIVLLILLGIIYYFFIGLTQGNHLVSSQKKINPWTSMTHSWNVLDVLGKLLFTAILFIWIASTSFDSSFNYYIRDVLLFPPSYNGYLKAIIGVFTLISNVTLTFYLIRKARLSLTMQILSLVMSVLFVGLLLFNELYLFIGIGLLLMAGFSIVQPIQQQAVSLISKHQESVHHLMGFFNAMKSLGGIIGSFSAGFIYELNPSGPFVFAFGFMVLAFICMSIYERKLKA